MLLTLTLSTITACRQYDASVMTRPERNRPCRREVTNGYGCVSASARAMWKRRSMELAEERHNPYLSFSRTWITDVETGRFVPGSFKMASLAEIYGMELDEIHKLYDVSRDITKERPAYRPPTTQLLTPGKQGPSEAEAETSRRT